MKSRFARDATDTASYVRQIGHSCSEAKNMFLPLVFAICVSAFVMAPGFCANDSSAGPTENPRFNDPGNLIALDQRKEIIALAQSIPDRTQPVLWIDVISKNEVEISTGVIRASLDGGGRIFKLRRENGKWVYIKEDLHRSWVSECNLKPSREGWKVEHSSRLTICRMQSEQQGVFDHVGQFGSSKVVV